MTAPVPRPSPTGSGWVLAATILASCLAFVDGSVVNVALPVIGHGLHADADAQQWILNGYALPLSALLLLGGAAGDRFGRRRLLVAGIATFVLASIGCAAAASADRLIGSRLLQGVGAAMLTPNSLAILGASFDGPARGRAVGTWAAAGAIGSAAGPVLGGVLIDTVGWRAIFLINLPIGLVAAALAWRHIPRDRPRADATPLDLLGAAIATAGLGALADALTRGAGPHGWNGIALATGGAAAVLLGVFLAVERRRGERAMIPLLLFGSSEFLGLTLLTLLLYGGLGVLFVLVPYVLIAGLHESAAQAGAALLPIPVVVGLTSRFWGTLAGRIGTRIPLVAGTATVACGCFLMLRVQAGAGAWTGYWGGVFPALLVAAIGLACLVAPLTTAVLGSVSAERTGAASGLNSAVARTGGLIATTLIGTVIASRGAALISAFHVACLLAGVSCAVAAVAGSLLLRGER